MEPVIATGLLIEIAAIPTVYFSWTRIRHSESLQYMHSSPGIIVSLPLLPQK